MKTCEPVPGKEEEEGGGGEGGSGFQTSSDKYKREVLGEDREKRQIRVFVFWVMRVKMMCFD